MFRIIIHRRHITTASLSLRRSASSPTTPPPPQPRVVIDLNTGDRLMAFTVYRNPMEHLARTVRLATLLPTLAGPSITFLYSFHRYWTHSEHRHAAPDDYWSNVLASGWEHVYGAALKWFPFLQNVVSSSSPVIDPLAAWTADPNLAELTLGSVFESTALVFGGCAFMYGLGDYATRPMVDRMCLLTAAQPKNRTPVEQQILRFCGLDEKLDIVGAAGKKNKSLSTTTANTAVMIHKHKRAPSKQSLADEVSPEMLEYFRMHQRLQFTVPRGIFGQRLVALSIRVRDLEKIPGYLGRGSHPLANLRHTITSPNGRGTAQRCYFIDWDALEDRHPQLWYLLHCTIPWASNPDSDL